jgi:hypothetical protein
MVIPLGSKQQELPDLWKLLLFIEIALSLKPIMPLFSSKK